MLPHALLVNEAPSAAVFQHRLVTLCSPLPPTVSYTAVKHLCAGVAYPELLRQFPGVKQGWQGSCVVHMHTCMVWAVPHQRAVWQHVAPAYMHTCVMHAPLHLR
jgi:hypothetical protein